MRITPTEPSDLTDTATSIRGMILTHEHEVRRLIEHSEKIDKMSEVRDADEYVNRKESYEQLKLAVRDIEAARMRLGKFLQYRADGVSVYDK